MHLKCVGASGAFTAEQLDLGVSQLLPTSRGAGAREHHAGDVRFPVENPVGRQKQISVRW